MLSVVSKTQPRDRYNGVFGPINPCPQGGCEQMIGENIRVLPGDSSEPRSRQWLIEGDVW